MNYKTTTTMNKLRQILQFIRALLGFLLGLKKKETTEKEEVALPGQSAGGGPCVTRRYSLLLCTAGSMGGKDDLSIA